MEFSKEIEELKKVSGKTKPLPKSGSLYTSYEALMNLAEISPRAAVVESFRILESLIRKEVASDKGKKPYLLHQYLPDLLDNQSYEQFHQLRKLRNSAAHAEDFNLEGMPIEAYIDIAT